MKKELEELTIIREALDALQRSRTRRASVKDIISLKLKILNAIGAAQEYEKALKALGM